jgi:SpoU rRNA methylase family enzyme
MMVAYHDVHSVAKLTEIYKIVKAFGADLFVISRPQGGAAQSGIPEVSARAFQEGMKILIVKDLPEALEILHPKKVIILSKRAEKPLDPSEVDENTLLVVTGTEPDVSKFDSIGELRYVEPKDLGDIGRITVALCKIRG